MIALPAALSDAAQAKLMYEAAAGPEGTLYRCKIPVDCFIRRDKTRTSRHLGMKNLVQKDRGPHGRVVGKRHR